jgi:hypothetical protein
LHADYADTFSISVEEMLPLLQKHLTAVGLDKRKLSLLKALEEADQHKYVIVKNHIASRLTKSERKYLEQRLPRAGLC